MTKKHAPKRKPGWDDVPYSNSADNVTAPGAPDLDNRFEFKAKIPDWIKRTPRKGGS